jgi:hypothetical protein
VSEDGGGTATGGRGGSTGGGWALPGSGEPVGPPRPVPPHQAGPYRTAGYRPAPYGSSPAPPLPRSAAGGAVQAPPRPAPADRAGAGAGRWVIVRAGVAPQWKRRVGWAWAGAAVGTAVATVVDRVVGGLDGRPALFLLVVLALPFWDGLPVRITTRLVELAAVVAVVAGLWFGIAALRPEAWWRAEIAYGIACGIAGTAHALLSRRRTVEP